MIPTLLCWWMYRESSSTWPHPRHQPLKTVPRDLVLVSRLWYLRCWTDLLITQNSLIKTFRFNSDPNLRILNTENIIRNVCNVSPYYRRSRYPFLGSIPLSFFHWPLQSIQCDNYACSLHPSPWHHRHHLIHPFLVNLTVTSYQAAGTWNMAHKAQGVITG